jgi:hypothetical protein
MFANANEQAAMGRGLAIASVRYGPETLFGTFTKKCSRSFSLLFTTMWTQVIIVKQTMATTARIVRTISLGFMIVAGAG